MIQQQKLFSNILGPRLLSVFLLNSQNSNIWKMTAEHTWPLIYQMTTILLRKKCNQ